MKHANHEPEPPTAAADKFAVPLATDAGWRRIGRNDGVPVWQWQEDTSTQVITYDHDVLRFFGAAMNYHDTASPADSHAFISAHLLNGRSGIPHDEPERSTI